MLVLEPHNNARLAIALLASFAFYVGVVLIVDRLDEGRAHTAGFATADEQKKAWAMGCASVACVASHAAEQQKVQEQLAQQRIANVSRVAIEQAQAAQRRIDKAAACQRNVVCRGQDHISDATVFCKLAIERRASYDFEWTDSWLKPAFSPMRAGSGKQIIYIGDHLKLQNAFGAWQRSAYTCTFNPQTNTVSAVHTQPGRIL